MTGLASTLLVVGFLLGYGAAHVTMDPTKACKPAAPVATSAGIRG